MKQSMNTKTLNSMKRLFNKNTEKSIKDIKVFDEELKVVDIDVSTIKENDVTKDGYIIDEMGNVKRLSDEAVLFLRKIFPKGNIASDRYINTIRFTNDEMKVVDIDLSTIELRNIHKDGYYFERDGNVRKISDEAILFLRRMFPNSVIAENRLRTVKEYTEDLAGVEELDLSTIDLKNVDMDGYFINEDGIVKRLSDEAVLFLRKTYKNNKIAFNRKFSEQKNVETVKTVRNSKKKNVNKEKAVLNGAIKIGTSVASTAKVIKDYAVTKKSIISEKINNGLSDVKSVGGEVKGSISKGVKNLKINTSKKASLLKRFFIDKTTKAFKSIATGLTKTKNTSVEVKNSLLKGIKNLGVNISGKISKLKDYVIEKKPILSGKIKTGLSSKKDAIIKGVKNLAINIKKALFLVKKKIILKKNTIFAARVKDDLDDLKNSVSRVTIDDLIEKESFSTKIDNLKINLKNKFFDLKNRIKLIPVPVYAKRIKCLKPERKLMDGLRPEEFQKESLSDRIKNFKLNLKSKVARFNKKMSLKMGPAYLRKNTKVKLGRILVDDIRPETKRDILINNLKLNIYAIKKRINRARKPVFARNEFTGETKGLREFKNGLRPEMNMGDLNMLERMGAYIKNIGKPTYAIRVQRVDGNIKKYKLEREPLFRSSYIVSNLKLLGRKITGIGGAVALSSSMISGFSNSAASVDTARFVDDEIVIGVFRELDKVSYSGTIELDDDDDFSYIQGILLDEKADKSLAAVSDEYTDDYDIDPLSLALDEGEGLVAGTYLNTEPEDDAVETLYYDDTMEEKNNVEKKLYYDMEDYVSYAMYNHPYTEVHELDISLIRDIIEKYSNIYNVNFDIVYSKLAELTNNFTSEEYINEKTISGVTCKGKQVYANSYEELLMLAVRSIAQLPNRFGINYNKLHNCDYYVSSDDYATEISHIAKLFNIDRCLVYAIIHTETNFVSDLFLQRNNPAGLMDNAKYCTFSSKEEGFIELCTEIRKYNERGAWTLEEMAEIHCKGNPKWAPTVREVYETVKSKENEIFANSNLVLNKTR